MDFKLFGSSSVYIDLFQVKANLHNKQLLIELNDTLVNGMIAEIDKMNIDLDVDNIEVYLESVFRTLEKAALQKVFF